MTDLLAPTTRVTPPSAAEEVETLLFALDRSRATFAWKCGGPDAAGLGRPHPQSTMTLGGLMRHLALVEDHDTSCHEARGPPMSDHLCCRQGLGVDTRPDRPGLVDHHSAPKLLVD